MRSKAVVAALVSIAAAPASAFAAEALAPFVEDCKYVSLNRALAAALTADGFDRLPALDERSYEIPKGESTRKVQAVLLRFRQPKAGVKDTFGMEFTLDDPETGRCALGASRALEKAAFDAPPDGSEKFWKACNRKAVNAALAAWFARNEATAAAVPQLSAASARLEQAADGTIRYEVRVFKRAADAAPTVNPPLDDAAAVRAAEGASETFSYTLRRTEDSCDIVR